MNKTETDSHTGFLVLPKWRVFGGIGGRGERIKCKLIATEQCGNVQYSQ